MYHFICGWHENFFSPINVLVTSFKDGHVPPYLYDFLLHCFPHLAKTSLNFQLFCTSSMQLFLILSVKISTLSFVLSSCFVYISLLMDLHYNYLIYVPLWFSHQMVISLRMQYTPCSFLLLSIQRGTCLKLDTWYVWEKKVQYILDKKTIFQGLNSCFS